MWGLIYDYYLRYILNQAYELTLGLSDQSGEDIYIKDINSK